jgi:hypothetical protein
MCLQMDTYRGIRAIGGPISSIFSVHLERHGKEQLKDIVTATFGIWIFTIPI